MTTQHDDKDLDRVEEIYLTQTQYIEWMSANTPRPDIFDTQEGRVVLKGLLPARKPPQPTSILSAMGPLAEAVLGPGWKRCEVQPPAPPPPVPVRKLERPADAAWTFFCHNCFVVGVHDDGTVVGRFTLWWPCNQEYRVTPDGVLHEHNKPIAERYMVDGSAKRIHGHFKRALTTWVKRGEGRKMPVGIRRLKKSIDSCSQGGGGFRSKGYFSQGDVITINPSDYF